MTFNSDENLNMKINQFNHDNKDLFPKEIKKLIELDDLERENNYNDNKIKIELVKEDFGTIN